MIQTNNKTVVRRYAVNSVKFDDAKPSKLAEIHPGDQLRARGTKNEDGTKFAAEEIVSGKFRNIAGTVTAINTTDSSLTVMDLLTQATRDRESSSGLETAQVAAGNGTANRNAA